jgi:hypothetical protein
MNLSFSLQALGKELSFMPPLVFSLGLFVCLLFSESLWEIVLVASLFRA